MACGTWGLSPSEFWRLSPEEFWWLFEAKTPPEQLITPADRWESLYKLLD